MWKTISPVCHRFTALLLPLLLVASRALPGPLMMLASRLPEVAQAERFRDNALAGTQAFEWVEQLTTEIGPRLAGSENEARARQWAVSVLEGFWL